MECDHGICQMSLYCTRCVAELEAENAKLRERLIKSQSTIRFAHDNSDIRLNPNWAMMMEAALNSGEGE